MGERKRERDFCKCAALCALYVTRLDLVRVRALAFSYRGFLQNTNCLHLFPFFFPLHLCIISWASIVGCCCCFLTGARDDSTRLCQILLFPLPRWMTHQSLTHRAYTFLSQKTTKGKESTLREHLLGPEVWHYSRNQQLLKK
jgi:hypothetical protein